MLAVSLKPIRIHPQFEPGWSFKCQFVERVPKGLVNQFQLIELSDCCQNVSGVSPLFAP